MTAPISQTLRQRAAEFTDEFLEPIAADLDRTGVFPRPLVAKLAAAGFLGLLQDDVAAGGFAGHVEVVHALSRSCPSVASILNNHAVAAHAIAKWGSDAQKANWLPRLASGEHLAALAILENGPTPGTGADALMGARKAGKFALSGTKVFVRNAGVADLYVVLANLPADGKPGPTAFIVEARTPGLAVSPRLETMGLKGCPVAHVVFNAVILGEDEMIGPQGGGAVIIDHLIAVFAVVEAAQTVAIGQAAISHAAGYARHRIQFRHPIGDLEAIQTLLADVATDTHLAWLGVQHAARLIDSGASFAAEAAMVKSFLGRCGPRMLIDAVQVEGGMGISETVPPHVSLSLPLARMFRDIAGTTLLDAPADFPDRVIAASIV